jgi:hypothetical protein
VTTGRVTTGSVTTGRVTTGRVTTGSVTTGRVTTGRVTTGSVTTGRTTTGRVTTGSVTTGRVTTGRVTTGSVTTGRTTTGSVTTGRRPTRPTQPQPSDLELKHDVVRIGSIADGIGLYRFQYNWSDQVYVGVIAQEVMTVRPDAVTRGPDGYLRVDYGRLGLRLQTWDEWRASAGQSD